MEFIYVIDNMDCFTFTQRYVMIDGEQVEMINILNDITDLNIYYSKDDKYVFTYVIPDDYTKKSIRAVTNCGLVKSINIADISNKKYIEKIQKETIEEYDNRTSEHTTFTNMLYNILTSNPQIIHPGSLNDYSNNTIDGGTENE